MESKTRSGSRGMPKCLKAPHGEGEEVRGVPTPRRSPGGRESHTRRWARLCYASGQERPTFLSCAISGRKRSSSGDLPGGPSEGPPQGSNGGAATLLSTARGEHRSEEEVHEAYVKVLKEMTGTPPMKLRLDALEEVALALGSPHHNFEAVHVAGYRVGLFTSPHLFSLRERFSLNGTCISEYSFLEVFAKVKTAASTVGVELTFFEVCTLMAFEFFASERVQWAVIETGLGGRLDATNLLVNPRCCVITSIGWDHMHILGETLEDIAQEKAGIFKNKVNVVLGPSAAALPLLWERAAALQCDVWEIRVDPRGEDFDKENSNIAELVAQNVLRLDLTQRVVIDVGHNESAVDRLFQVVGHQHFGCRVRVVFCLSGERPPTVLNPIVAQLFFPLNQRLTAASSPLPPGEGKTVQGNSARVMLRGVDLFFFVLRRAFILQRLTTHGVSPLRQCFGISAATATAAQSRRLRMRKERHLTLVLPRECMRRLQMNGGWYLDMVVFGYGGTLPRLLQKAFAAAAAEGSVLAVCGTFFMMREVFQTFGMNTGPIDPMDMNERSPTTASPQEIKAATALQPHD
ncbi:bifunctional protein subfamily protein [Cyclospora cayetanensis]|uniref:Bifunctional protein subfamily protein n=1 Tax=Cyclospora cayetanensis TaxID=88456 RepID=A0A1D3CYI2_9EIME|nr:bifunctional protein subfamily protein [Cyclospora cayetanensis]